MKISENIIYKEHFMCYNNTANTENNKISRLASNKTWQKGKGVENGEKGIFMRNAGLLSKCGDER